MADEEGYMLTASAVARTAKVVRRVLGDHGVSSPPGFDGDAEDDRGIYIKITANAAGGGKYLASWLKPPTTDITETGNLALADIGVETTADVWWTKIIALNLPENGKTTHALSVGTVCRARVHRLQTKTLVVVIESVDFFDCA